MFDKHFHIKKDDSVKAARIVNRGLERLGSDLKTISTAEIESKDRVDITLKEYEKLKKNARDYEERCRKMGAMIMRLGIPYEVVELVDLDSIHVETSENPYNFKRYYKISFSVDYHQLRMRGL